MGATEKKRKKGWGREEVESAEAEKSAAAGTVTNRTERVRNT